MDITTRYAFSALLITVVTVSYGKGQDVSVGNSVSSGLNEFSVTLLKHMFSEKPDNLVFSPLSIGAALGMLSEGAEGNTYNQIAKLLSLPDDVTSKRENFQSIFKTIKERNSDNSVNVGDKAYVHDGFTISPQFLDVIQKYYDADAETVDFSQTEPAADTINDWVSNITNGRINKIIDSGVVNENTKMVLVNAVFLNASWSKPFLIERTSEKPFSRSENDIVNITMMDQYELFLAVELEELQAKVVELPYVKNEYRMLVVLPERIDGLPEVLDKMSNFSTLQIRKKMSMRKVHLQLPKFKIVAEMNLEDPLTKLGANDMFDSVLANLTGITGPATPSLYVTAAVHKAEIETTEVGTIASAATGISFGHKQGGGSNLPTIEFNANRPFLFFIFDSQTDAPLFAGTVTSPTPQL